MSDVSIQRFLDRLKKLHFKKNFDTVSICVLKGPMNVATGKTMIKSFEKTGSLKVNLRVVQTFGNLATFGVKAISSLKSIEIGLHY